MKVRDNYQPSQPEAETDANLVHMAEELTAEPEVDTRCGYGSCKPDAIQICNNPKMLLFFLCIFTVSQGFVVNGINNVNTSTIERRFQLPSSRVGMISSSYDFSAAIFGIVISFFGSGRNKAKWVSMAAVVMACGSLIMALPHFTTGLYEWGQGVSMTCGANSTVSTEKCESSGLQNYLAVLMVGMILHGIGGCTLYTIGVGYIDDSVSANNSPLYIGFMYGAASLGPGLGYIIGGQLLNIYVDFDKVDTTNIPLTTSDPRWVGAWWAGFLVTFTTCLLIAIPLSCYGAEMPTAKKVRESRVSQTHKGTDPNEDATMTSRLPVRDMPKTVMALLRNPPFVFIMFAGATEGIITSGFATFVPKFIQNHFGVTAGTAALYTGAAAVPGAAGGMFFGGFICRRFKLKVRGMLKFSICTCLVTMLFCTLLWVSCGDQQIGGLTKTYANSSRTGSLTDSCNSDCRCATEFFEPVCDHNGLQYFSPCHAGCQTAGEDKETFTNCSCVDVGPGANVSMVTSGTCGTQCGLLYLFLPMFFVTIFLTFLPGTPSDAATLRCIHANHRTFSMGMKWFVIRFVGTVPGPIIFGAVTDTACTVWQTECGENSSCWIYDNFAVSRNYFLIAISAKVMSAILFFCAFWFYKPPECDRGEPQANGEALSDAEKKRQMAFVNGSFRASEFEASVIGKKLQLPSDSVTEL